MMYTDHSSLTNNTEQPRALTIAGSDSGAGAGIQADLKTFAALGVYGLSALTALTAQNTLGVHAIMDAAPEFVEAQIDAVLEDIGTNAAKTGMLSSPDIIRAVASRVRKWQLRLVVDPVMTAKGGDLLLQPEAVATLRTELLPLAEVVTPNLPEAEVLVGRRIETLDDMREAATILHELGPKHVVIKGGHRATEPVDIYFDGTNFIELRAERIQTMHTHGTGCTFSAAIAAFLARGFSVEQAVTEAKHYITEAIRHAPALGHGHGPVDHFWQYERRRPARLSRTHLIPRLALHVLTDRALSRGRDLLTVASAAIDGGATVIQLRDKQADTRSLVEQGLLLRTLTRGRDVLFIVNDRIDVALAVDADGVHLGQDDDMPIQQARRLLGPQRLLGISAGNPAEVATALAADADYLSIGPIYPTQAKANAGSAIGLPLLTEVASGTTIPVIGIGGITAENAGAIIQAGGVGVAVITAVVSAADISAAAHALAEIVRKAGT
ncbi:MAG TPA: bifunctional hydroxymethylpyrimidine kinase/phosphomethylpyrimidine kinase [Ktedonobacteraceae bacterium]|nr:bifunctional hydroxymethylpyrimidine kinase/phosphomethylpyrimidine kinase [Ktedonobacteraceae bacterium]